MNSRRIKEMEQRKKDVWRTEFLHIAPKYTLATEHPCIQYCIARQKAKLLVKKGGTIKIPLKNRESRPVKR